MAESLPPALHPPVAVALAKLVKTFPGPNALPGGLTAEPTTVSALPPLMAAAR